MGQIQDKCSCIFQKEDNSNFQFEKEKKSEEKNEESKLTKKSSFSFKDKILNSRNFDKSKDDNGNIVYTENNNKSLSAKRNGKLNLQDNSLAYKHIVKFQSVVRGYFFRKKFPDLKNLLVEIEIELVSKYEKNYKMNVILKVDIDVNSTFSRDGWKKYNYDSSVLNFDYGRVYRTKFRIINSSTYYSGEMNINDEMHGYGELINLNGVKKEGFWRNNKQTGFGRLTDIDGVIYEGIFENGILNGKGSRITHKGIYNGEFKNGLREGIGTEDNIEHSYIGEYRNDKKNGNGKLFYKILNDTYIGEFNDNCITGNGIYTWANKDSFEGQFLNGKMHGRGTYRWPDGGEYIGEYINSIKEGRGRFKWSNGKIFDGPFRNGRPHGKGKLIFGDNIIEVEFCNGKLSKSNTKELVNKNLDKRSVSSSSTPKGKI